MKKIDLHIHSYYSHDGEYGPLSISRNSKKGRSFAVISLTDHNNTEKISEDLSAGKRYSIEVIPGIEIDASCKWIQHREPGA